LGSVRGGCGGHGEWGSLVLGIMVECGRVMDGRGGMVGDGT